MAGIGTRPRIEEMKTQKCKTCNEWKALDREYFHVHPGNTNGFAGVCKDCKNARKRERRQQPVEVVPVSEDKFGAFEVACLREEIARGQTMNYSMWR